jgi:hypothetical protein
LMNSSSSSIFASWRILLLGKLACFANDQKRWSWLNISEFRHPRTCGASTSFEVRVQMK